jgi:CrcB protein
MRAALWVAAGGVLGALGRFWLAGAVHRWLGAGFPFGTFAVNALGCLAIGAVLYLTEERPALGPEARLFVAIGVLGSFTTFSTFGLETFAMLRERDLVPAVLNVFGSVAVGLLAVWLGHALARAVWR